jgi:hypothetical protein
MGHRAGLDKCGKYRPPPGFDPRTVQTVATFILRPYGKHRWLGYQLCESQGVWYHIWAHKLYLGFQRPHKRPMSDQTSESLSTTKQYYTVYTDINQSPYPSIVTQKRTPHNRTVWLLSSLVCPVG